MLNTEKPSRPRVNRKIMALALVSSLAIGGQWYLSQQRVAAGLVCYLLAIVSFEFLVIRPGWSDPAFFVPRIAARLKPPILGLTSLAFVAFVTAAVHSRDESPTTHWITLAAWIADILVFSATILASSSWRPPRLVSIWFWIKSHWLEVAGISLVILAALILRIYDLSWFPYPPYNDEGWVGVEALNFLGGTTTDFFGIGWSSQPNLSFMPGIPAIWLFQNTIFAVRLVSAVEGTLTVLFLYLLARQEFGVKPAFLAAGILSALPVHLQFSRTGFNNIIPGLFASLVLWLTLRAIHSGRLSSYLWAGLASGFALYSYLGSRAAIVLAIGLLVYTAISFRGYLKYHLKGLLVFAGAAVIVMAPAIVTFSLNPAHFMARMNRESIFANNWLATEMSLTGKNLIQVLLSQLGKCFLVFTSQPAPMGFFNSPQPYFSAMIVVFFVLGLGYFIFHMRNPAHMAVIAWFWAVIISAGVLTVNAPASQRLVMSLPAAALFAGMGLHLAVQAFERARLVGARFGLVICLAVPLVYGIQATGFYFGAYRGGNYLSDASNEVIIESIEQLKSTGSGTSYFLLGGGRIHLEFANYAYLLPDTQKYELESSIEELLANYQPDTPALFISVPEQRGSLVQIMQALPGGSWQVVKRKTYPDQDLYFSYLVPGNPN